MKEPISVALTHYNRPHMLLEAVRQVIGDPRVAEIVVSDDASEIAAYETLVQICSPHPKVKLFRNERNLDCYANKAQVLRLATLPWTILFDSDNILTPQYLDVLYALPKWDSSTFYCPDFAMPHFDYTMFAGKLIDAQNVSGLMGREVIGRVATRRGSITRYVLPAHHSRFRCALNTANYFVHRESYLEVWDGSVEPHTADTIYHAYNWLRSGRNIYIVPGLRYEHRIHDQSHYKLNVRKTGDFAKQVEDLLVALPNHPPYEPRNTKPPQPPGTRSQETPRAPLRASLGPQLAQRPG